MSKLNIQIGFPFSAIVLGILTALSMAFSNLYDLTDNALQTILLLLALTLLSVFLAVILQIVNKLLKGGN